MKTIHATEAEQVCHGIWGCEYPIFSAAMGVSFTLGDYGPDESRLDLWAGLGQASQIDVVAIWPVFRADWAFASGWTVGGTVAPDMILLKVGRGVGFTLGNGRPSGG